MTVDEFYSSDENETNFIDRISAFLGISFDRVKIVGFRDTTTKRIL